MNLLVDIGNSNFKWCFSDGKNLDEIHSFQYSAESIEDLLASKVVNEKNSSDINNVFACCVASTSVKAFFSAWVTAKIMKTVVYFESAKAAFGVQNCYIEPSHLGNDRWLSIVFSFNYYQSDVCVIDCGTAITIDVVLKNGEHQGGLIAPGYKSQIAALDRKTSIINNQNFVNQKASSILQNNTHLCIEQGCRVMSLGFIKDVVGQLKQQYGDSLKIIIMGGDSESFAFDLPSEWQCWHDLLFYGLQFFSMQKTELNKA